MKQSQCLERKFSRQCLVKGLVPGSNSSGGNDFPLKRWNKRTNVLYFGIILLSTRKPISKIHGVISHVCTSSGCGSRYAI